MIFKSRAISNGQRVSVREICFIVISLPRHGQMSFVYTSINLNWEPNNKKLIKYNAPYVVVPDVTVF